MSEAGTQDGDGLGAALLSRRSFLAAGGGGALAAAALVGAGVGGHAIADAPAGASVLPRRATASPTGRFRSEPSLIPPRLQVTHRGAPPDGAHLLITPSLLPTVRGMSAGEAVALGKGQAGIMITNELGELTYFQPSAELVTNLQVQEYLGKPVLTYWKGAIAGGIGYGDGYVLDSAYETVALIKAGNGLKVDLHELTLTQKGTALITAYRERTADLSSIGGPKSGPVQDSVVQEIDIASGKVLFQWNSLDHIPVEETYLPYAKGSFDYFHVNSVALWDEESLLVSARNTWAIYRISRTTGAVIWRMHGKASDFEMAPGTTFEWQHHARHLGNGQVSVFDDGAAPAEERQSRALLLAVDEGSRKVGLVRAYLHPARLLTEFEGSTQQLPNGNVFVGYGSEPYMSQFDKDGRLVLDIRFPTEVQSYRAFRSLWVGRPKAPPKVAFESDGAGGYAVYVSWHGATEVASWQVLAGRSPSQLSPVATVPRAGFETAITVHPGGSHLAVEALDSSGARLGVSQTYAL